MVLKVVALGFLRHPGITFYKYVMVLIIVLLCHQIGAYLRSKWNQLDFFILITSILSVLVSDTAFRFSRAFRAFRALRPLRVVTAFPNTRIVLSK
jgi:uncharacterized membrane protein